MAEDAANLSKTYERNSTYRTSIHSISVAPMTLLPMQCNDGISERHTSEYDTFEGSRT